MSRVVNGSPQVSREARAAVEQAIEELGYVPNRAARALVTQRTDSVALVVSESGGAGLRRAVLRRHRPRHQLRAAETPLQLWLAMAQSRPSGSGSSTT